MTDDKKSLTALMDLAQSIAGMAKEIEAQCRLLVSATRLPGTLLASSDGQAARTAVAATERRYDRMRGLEPIEADDSRVTDGHKCCGGKPDCGCVRSVGG